VVIPSGAKNTEGAWELMKWFAGNPGQKQYTEESSHMPTIQELAEDEALFDEEHKFFRQLLDVAQSRPPLPVGALYWDELSRAEDAVVLNQKQPMEALETAESRVQSQLQKFC
jgi:multiple sugar transport system substrate-binding protein